MTSNTPYFPNRIIWLTGSSSGIGEALAKELYAQGATLALTARRADVLHNLASALNSVGATSERKRVHVFPGDVTDLEQMKACAAEIEKTVGPIDYMIANAGTHYFTQPVEDFSSTEYLTLMNLNYGGILRCIEAALPYMLQRKKGTIVGVASLSGYRGVPRAGAYGASKAASINFLESLRFHLEKVGLFVTIVNPGFVRTPLTDKNDFKMPFLIEADAAARIIAKGIANRKKEITFPIPFNWIMKTLRIIPYPLYEVLGRLAWKATKNQHHK